MKTSQSKLFKRINTSYQSDLQLKLTIITYHFNLSIKRVRIIKSYNL